jgi:hypothetical protein
METQIEPVVQVRDWAIERIETIKDQRDALALVAEFDEWIDIDDEEEITYFCLEDDNWTDEQEIDVR